MKKILSIILTVSLLVVSLAFVAGAEEFDPRAICEGVTLHVAVREATRIADWENNEETKYIEDTLGVKLVFDVYPSADFSSKINAMVMAGDKLPDLIIGSTSGWQNWAREGALLELTPYYEDPNFSANIRAQSEGAGYDIGSYMKDGDGKIYGIPKLEQGLGMQSKYRFWIYKPWLDQMGAEVPTNIDEFYEICKYVQENDMNGNGDTTDEYIIMGSGFHTQSAGREDWFAPLMSAFIYAWDDNFVVVNDGEVSFAYTSDAWKEGLKYLKRFFDEGLMGTYLFTNSADDSKAIQYTEPIQILTFAGWAWEGADYKIRTEWTYIDGMKGPDGQEGYSQYMPILPSVGGVIAADCENPDAAFLVADLLCSEYVSLITRYGKEGEHWAYWDTVLASDVLNPADFAAQGGDAFEIKWNSTYKVTDFWSSTETQTASWLQVGPFIRNAALQNVRGKRITADTENDRLLIEAAKIDIESKFAGIANAPAEVFDYAPLTTEQTEIASEIQLTLNNYVQEMTAAFLTGSKDIDAEWDAYLAELDKIGIEELQEIYQAAYTLVH